MLLKIKTNNIKQKLIRQKNCHHLLTHKKKLNYSTSTHEKYYYQVYYNKVNKF